MAHHPHRTQQAYHSRCAERHLRRGEMKEYVAHFGAAALHQAARHDPGNDELVRLAHIASREAGDWKVC